MENYIKPLGSHRELLCEYLSYDPESLSGLKWIKRSGNSKVGDVAGTINSCGYWKVTLKKRQFYAHRIVWFLCTGIWSDKYINHQDLNRSNNILSNLTEETHKTNSQYRKTSILNTSGVTGISFITDKRFNLEYVNCFYLENGKPINKRFSINKLGKDLALKLAIRWRDNIIKDKIEQGDKYLTREQKNECIR